MIRALTIASLTFVVALASACKTDEQAGSSTTGEVAPAPTPAPMPTTEAEFLAELIPVPDGLEAVEITYAVTGPALEGEMTILVAEGGRKREQWELRTTGSSAQLRSAGLAIVNAEQIWHGAEAAPGEVQQNQLGPLAHAWVALDEGKRAAVVEAIREWHAKLAQRRAEVPGDQAEVLGVRCLQTRVAAQNLCMWEDVGLFLRYEGSAFTIEATQIDRAPKLAADAFALPPEASAATIVEVPPVDFSAALDRAAGGDFAELLLLVSKTRALPKLERPVDEPAEKD